MAMPAGGYACIRFVLECPDTRIGEHIRVVGAPDELGAWSPGESSVDLRTSHLDFPTWRSDWQYLPVGKWEYKYVRCRDGGEHPRWEDRIGNRELEAVAEKGCLRFVLTVVERFDGPRSLLQLDRTEAKHEEEGGAEVRVVVPKLPLKELAQLEEYEAGSSSQNPRRYSFSAFSGRKTLLTPRDGCAPGLRRSVSIGCLAELPAGMLPTRRALGLQSGGGEELVREAVCAELQDPNRPGKGKGQLSQYSSSTASASTCTVRGLRPIVCSQTSEENDAEGEGGDSFDDRDEGGPGEPKEFLALTDASGSDLDWGSGSEDILALTEESGSDLDCDSPDQPKGFEDCYSLRNRLGEGAFGVVYACVARDANVEFAVKVVQRNRLSPLALEYLIGNPSTGMEGEVALHLSLPRHSNVVGLHNFFEEPWGFRLVLDLCHGGDLFNEIVRAKKWNAVEQGHGALAAAAARNVLRQLLTALAFCHGVGVAHRDVKVENVLLERPASEAPLEGSAAVIKLCDFGLAARCSGPEATLDMPVGSPDYIAPEVARMEPYGNKVDVWSAGAVLFVALRGCMPFPAKTDMEALVRVRAGNYVFDECWDHIPAEARASVEGLMVLDPDARPSALGGLNLPWLRA